MYYHQTQALLLEVCASGQVSHVSRHLGVVLLCDSTGTIDRTEGRLQPTCNTKARTVVQDYTTSQSVYAVAILWGVKLSLRAVGVSL